MKTKWLLLFFVCAAGFQNCSGPAPLDENFSLTPPSEEDFPLQVKVTEIAMNTCWNPYLFANQSGYGFHISLAAAGSGGLRVRPSILQTLKKDFRTTSGLFDVSGAAKSLSSRIPSASLQAGFRSSVNLSDLAYEEEVTTRFHADFGASGGLSVQPVDVTVQDAVKAYLLADESYVGALDGAPIVIRLRPFHDERKSTSCQAANCLDHEIVGESRRRQLMSGGVQAPLLTTVFVDSMRRVQRLRDQTDAKYGIGQGFRFEFSSASANWDAMNILTKVTEYDLEKSRSQTSGSWNCPASLRLRVARGVDSCPNNESHPLSAQVRRHLAASEWDINIAQGCVKPKYNDCYGTLPSLAYSIVASPGQACSSIGNSTTSRCSHYFSLCERAN